MKLIALTGGDGSGKSTQIQRLTEHLAERGVRVSTAWCRWDPILPRPLMFILKRTIFRRTSVADAHIPKEEGYKYSRWQNTKRSLFRSRFLRGLWWNFAVVDYLLQARWKLFMARRNADVVIVDRYTDDLVVDQSLNFGFAPESIVQLSRGAWTKLFPAKRLTIYLDLPPAIAMERKSDIPSIEYLEQLRAAYTALCEANGYVIIDASQPIDTVHEDIARHVDAALGLCG